MRAAFMMNLLVRRAREVDETGGHGFAAEIAMGNGVIVGVGQVAP